MRKNDRDWMPKTTTSTPQAYIWLKLYLCVAFAFVAGCVSVPDGGVADARRAGFEELLESVVRIDVWENTFEEGARRTQRGVGSGVILSADGYILTNAHVVSTHAVEIIVTLANLERVDARLVGWDHWTDLALLQLDMEEIGRRKLGFEHAKFGASKDLYAGQTVYAVGTPNGLTRTVTRGIISNPRRYFAANSQVRGYETGFFNNWLQTDAAINPGNSGGPLVDEAGRVVGINTRSYLGANNLSFAVPGYIAEQVVGILKRDGKVVRSYSGIRPTPLQDLESFFGLEANQGVLVDSVDPASPAAVAGLRPGDILLKMDGLSLDGRFPEQLPPFLNQIARRPVGSEVTFECLRHGEVFSLTLVTELLQSRMGEQWAFEKWGLSVQELSPSIARERQLESSNGVLVLGVQGAFPADAAGLRSGDIILSVNREPVAGIEQLKNVYEGFQEDPQRQLFEVQRNHQVSYLVLRPRP